MASALLWRLVRRHLEPFLSNFNEEVDLELKSGMARFPCQVNLELNACGETVLSSLSPYR